MTNTTIITKAQTRWMQPAPWKPPNALRKVAAQGSIGKEQRQPGERAADEGQHEQRVQHALDGGEPPVVAAAPAVAWSRQSPRFACVIAVSCFSLHAVRALGTCAISRRAEPEHGVDAEEREHADTAAIP